MRIAKSLHEPGAPDREASGGEDAHTFPASDVPLPPTSNLLLATLPAAAFARFAPHLEWIALPRGKVLAEHAERLTHAYFPTDGIVSVMASPASETSMEIAVIGNEGMISVSIILEGLGSTGPLRRSVVQVAGHAYRLRAEILMAEFGRAEELQHNLLRFTQALITQVAQIAACNRCHTIVEQLCRWLLQRWERLPGAELDVTQQEIADLLGVRREGVSEAAGRLQEAGLIRYERGRVAVVDEAGLATRECECRNVIQKEYARLLGQAHPDRRQHDQP